MGRYIPQTKTSFYFSILSHLEQGYKSSWKGRISICYISNNKVYWYNNKPVSVPQPWHVRGVHNVAGHFFGIALSTQLVFACPEADIYMIVIFLMLLAKCWALCMNTEVVCVGGQDRGPGRGRGETKKQE